MRASDTARWCGWKSRSWQRLLIVTASTNLILFRRAVAQRLSIGTVWQKSSNCSLFYHCHVREEKDDNHPRPHRHFHYPPIHHVLISGTCLLRKLFRAYEMGQQKNTYQKNPSSKSLGIGLQETYLYLWKPKMRFASSAGLLSKWRVCLGWWQRIFQRDLSSTPGRAWAWKRAVNLHGTETNWWGWRSEKRQLCRNYWNISLPVAEIVWIEVDCERWRKMYFSAYIDKLESDLAM